MLRTWQDSSNECASSSTIILSVGVCVRRLIISECRIRVDETGMLIAIHKNNTVRRVDLVENMRERQECSVHKRKQQIMLMCVSSYLNDGCFPVRARHSDRARRQLISPVDSKPSNYLTRQVSYVCVRFGAPRKRMKHSTSKGQTRVFARRRSLITSMQRLMRRSRP